MKAKILFLLIITVLFCSCGKASNEQEVQDSTARLTVLDKETKKTEVEHEITLSMRSPKTMNPLLNEYTTVDRVLKLIFEPLFNISEEQSVIANLAEGYTFSSDGLTLTVKLKSGLKWQDGEPITAADIAYSLDVIQSASDFSVYKYVITNMTGWDVSDDLTLNISYASPYSQAPYNLAFPIIPKHHYQGNSDSDFDTVGSGSYSLSEYNNSGLTLTAAEGVYGKAQIPQAKIIISTDKETDYNAFAQGLTDILDVESSDWFSFFSSKDCGKAIYSTNTFEYLGFNNSKDMFKNQALKQAIAYCIDREQIISGIYMNNMDSSLTPVNPTAYMSSKDTLPSYDYDTDEALKTLWQASLSPYNFTFSILVNDDNSARVETAKIIAESLNRIGMNVTVNSRPYEEYIELINSDEFDVFIGGANLRCGFDLRPMLLSSSAYSGTNYVNFSDAQMDTLLTAEAEALTPEAQKKALGEVERYISQTLPLIGIGFSNGAVLTNPNLKGVTIPYISNPYTNSAVWSFE
ncbi:MAG: ABC transporter substrate-binding protein [Clostridiales bacterium]|nr:ABC transporter substrate-binding protein [Clostridiales bacterium]